jgi:hypothetical protein
MLEIHACGAEQQLFGVQCQLPFGHNEPHKHEDANGVVTWEPTYVGDLRRQVERLTEALDGLAHAAREFSTEADYTVQEAVEEEFVAALDYAEGMVRSAV